MGLTQAQLAELLDLNRSGNEIGYYECGKRRPAAMRLRVLQALQLALERCPVHVIYPRPHDEHGRPIKLEVGQRLRLIFDAAYPPLDRRQP